MKFEGSGPKGTQVIERKRSVTDGQTARRTRQKQYVSPRGGGDIIITYLHRILPGYYSTWANRIRIQSSLKGFIERVLVVHQKMCCQYQQKVTFGINGKQHKEPSIQTKTL